MNRIKDRIKFYKDIRSKKEVAVIPMSKLTFLHPTLQVKSCSYTSICICDEGEPIEDCRIKKIVDILHNELGVLFVPYIFNPIKLTTLMFSSYYPITRSYL